MNNSDNYLDAAKTWLSKKYEISGYFSIICVLPVIPLLIILTISFLADGVLAQTYSFIATTRGSFDKTNGSMIHQANLPSALSVLNTNNCPGELAIYVHGVWTNDIQAREQTDRVFLSLQNSGYNIPLIGFSWDSDTAFSFVDTSISQNGWVMAKKIANENGPILGKFIVDFKDMCPNDKVRLIAHSLGSRVSLSAIQWIYDNYNEENNAIPKKITSTHLLGAAINNEQVSMDSDDCYSNNPPLPCNGEAIYSEVGRFYNLYNPEDNMLQYSYRDTEGDHALGWCGVKGGPQNFFNPSSCVGGDPILTPNNYEEHNVISEIRPDDDADKDGKCDLRITIFSDSQTCTIALTGDNHLGYMGYRSGINSPEFYDNGAIDFVTMNWRNE